MYPALRVRRVYNELQKVFIVCRAVWYAFPTCAASEAGLRGPFEGS